VISNVHCAWHFIKMKKQEFNARYIAIRRTDWRMRLNRIQRLNIQSDKSHDRHGKVECGLLYLGRYSDRDDAVAVMRFIRWSRNGRRTRWKSCYLNTMFLSKNLKQRFHTRKRECLQLWNSSFYWYQEFLRLYYDSIEKGRMPRKQS